MLRSLVAFAVLACATASPLWDYVHEQDSHYSYYDTTVRLTGLGWTGYVLNMTSQQWLDCTQVDRCIWTHQLVVIVPDTLKYTDSAGLYVTGNGNDNPGPPSATDEDIVVSAYLAVANGIVTGTLFQIPNEPIVFASDPSQQSRSEDALVAWTWRMYMLEGAPAHTIAYFPMVKATVRAMDTIEDFVLKTFGHSITKHMVAGASKRGWDTWLTGAVDTRIIGIAPIVMDMLNFTQNVRHMYRSYGGWTFAFEDYYNANVTLLLGTNASAVEYLAQQIDPLMYAANLTMPKLVIDATGDEFFMPDDDWFWWGDLEGETNRLMIANAEHSEATGLLTLLPGVTAFFEGILTNTPRPVFTWTMDPVSGDITIITKTQPSRVILRFATTFDAVRRDFRLVKGDTPQDPCTFIPVKIFGTACINPVLWGYEDVAPTSVANGVYTYTLSQPLPPSGWRGFLGELRFPGPNGMEFIMTTQVSIIPNTFPFPGAHCAMAGCRQQDFLPFKCDMCEQKFCLTHRLYLVHSCPKAGVKDCRVITCPLCKQNVSLVFGEDPNTTWEAHAKSSSCDPTKRVRKHTLRCAAAGCKQKLLSSNKITCSRCLQDVCMRHRFEADHACTGVVAHASTGAHAHAHAPAPARAGFLRAFDARAGPAASAPAATPAVVGAATGNSRSVAPQSASQGPALPPRSLVHTSTPVAPVAASTPSSSATPPRASLTASRAPAPAPAPARAPAPTPVEVCGVCGSSFPGLTELLSHAEVYHSAAAPARTYDYDARTAPSVPRAASTSGSGGGGGAAAAGSGVSAGAGSEVCPQCSRRFTDVALLISHVDTEHSKGASCAVC